MAYVTPGYEEGEAISSGILSPVIWVQNLETLGPETRLELTFDSVTGKYALEPLRSNN